MNFEEFEIVYKPIKNPYTKEGSFNNTYFETYGKELEYVKSSEFSDKQIWTLINVDNENSYITPGYHIVNREAYFLTEIPWEDSNVEIDINERISFEKAVDACIYFFNDKLDRYIVSSFFIDQLGDLDDITIGDAKYTAIDLWESLGNELTLEQEDKIHDYYSSLI